MGDFAASLKKYFFQQDSSDQALTSTKRFAMLNASGEPIGSATWRNIASSIVPAELYVDMGLPSGILWAKKNIDVTQANGFAADETQYECTFFSWGNVEGHNPTSSSAFDYDWGSSNDGPYASTPGATLTGDIPLTFDAARHNLGCWRMPTTDEFAELFNTTYIDYIDESGNVITSQTDKLAYLGPNHQAGLYIRSKANGNKLFFPCSGSGSGSSWNDRGSSGLYWSSSLYSSTYGGYLGFYSGGVDPQGSNARFHGFAVRPVL